MIEVLIGMAGLVIVGSVINAIVRNKARRQLMHEAEQMSMTATAISRVADGSITTVTGRVRAMDEVLRAPLTDRECVAFRVHARLRQPRSVSATSDAVNEVEETRGVPFRVVDETGEAVVEVRSPHLLVAPERVSVISDIGGATGMAREWLSRLGAPIHDAGPFEEAVIRQGDVVVVRGKVIRRPAGNVAADALTYRDAARHYTTHITEDGSQPDGEVRIALRRPSRARG